MTSAHSRAARLVRYTGLTTVVAAGILTASPIAQPPQARDGRRDWAAWLNAVNTHAAGAADAAVARVAPWSSAELASLLPDLLQHVDPLRIVERGLVLHADVAVLHRVPGGYTLPAGPGDVTLVEDGRAVGQMSGTVHWAFARHLLERLPDSEDRTRLGRRFYRATAAVLQQWGEYPELTTHLSDGLDLIGDDAVLLMYEGTMHQAYAGPRMQRFFDDRRRAESAAASSRVMRLPDSTDPTMPPVVRGAPPALPSIRDSRARAERLFRRALAVDPAFAEARIRLAHMLGDRGRHDEAAAELARLRVDQLPPLLDYYAALLTGREARARGQLDTARAAFERAAKAYPDAPAPRYGLSEIAMARGDRAGALAQLVSRPAGAPDAADEPWWWIDRVHEPSAATLMNDFRRPGRQ